MDKRKVLRIILKVMLVVMAIALLEISIRFVFGKFSDYGEVKKEEKEKEEIYNSYDSTVKRNVEQFTKNVFEALLDKDYEYVFYSLDSAYKKYMFDDDIESMKNYIQNYLAFGEDYAVINISSTGNFYNVIVGVTTDAGYKTQHFSVKFINPNEFSLAFGDFESFRESDIKYITSKLECNIKYIYSVSDVVIYVLDIKNNSTENMNIKFNKISLVSTSGTLINGGGARRYSD